MIITFPTNMQLNDWSDQVVLDLDQHGVFSKLVDDDWRQWGTQFLGNTELGSYNLPNPYYFGDWQDWAERFCGALG